MANANFFSPDGGITRYPLEDTEGRIMYEDGIDGINLLKYPFNSATASGDSSIITDNKNGTYTFNGTTTQLAFQSLNGRNRDVGLFLPNGKYKATGCPSGGGNNRYYMGLYCTKNGASYALGIDYGEGVEITINGDDFSSEGAYVATNFYVVSGNTVNFTWEPMITEAKYAGIPYRPYNQQSIQHQINAQTGVLGAKNLLENINTTYTEEGATWTVNSNKTVTINKPNASTNASYMRINYASDSNHSMALDAAPYIGKLLKASFLDSAINGIGGRVGYFTSGSNTFNAIDDYFSTSKTFTVPSNAEKIVMYLRVDASVTISNVTVKPMLRLASDPSDEYVPFAMTNRELTENAVVKEYSVTSSHTINTNTTKITKQGRVCSIVVRLTLTSNTAANAVLATIPEETRPYTLFEFNGTVYNGSEDVAKMFTINANGQLTCREALTSGYLITVSCTYITNK